MAVPRIADVFYSAFNRIVTGGAAEPRFIVGGTVRSVLSNDNRQSILIDPLDNALVTEDRQHYETHEGDTFLVSYKSPDATPIADNGTINFALTTGAKTAHIIATAAGGGDTEIEILEGTTFTPATGTATTPYNKNRTSTNMPAATVRRDVTITVAGTLLFNKFFPGGTAAQAQGVTESTRDEWIFRPSTVYAFRITNRAGTQQPMSMALEWYEEPA